MGPRNPLGRIVGLEDVSLGRVVGNSYLGITSRLPVILPQFGGKAPRDLPYDSLCDEFKGAFTSISSAIYNQADTVSQLPTRIAPIRPCLASRCDTIRPHAHLLWLRDRSFGERPFLFFLRACHFHSRYADLGAKWTCASSWQIAPTAKRRILARYCAHRAVSDRRSVGARRHGRGLPR